MRKFDNVEQCIQECQSAKWRFKLITNITTMAALRKNMPMGCPDSVIPEPNKDKEPYKDHLCLFRTLARYMNGYKDLYSHTSRYFTEFVSKSGDDP